MKSNFESPPSARRRKRAFSLVETVVAIGIFSFVIVGILGLFPAGMKRQAEARAEARARIIAESIFECIKASESLANSKIPSEIENPYGLQSRSHLQGTLLGYAQDGTSINYLWPPGSTSDWANGNIPANQSITTKARIQVTPVPDNPNLYQVTVDVGSPANLPENAMQIFSFTTLVYSPPST
jgi:type II secretory pathway pseudopilin PulG